ncbi:hypothetical protein AABB24_021512 [Solanum stoloniferum]|uniref:Transposase-associated domain-containing protein n=1 Tax=Solanum stoloniferum TaxID=62892 RepID=A0ABD2SVR0_9SOLN
MLLVISRYTKIMAPNKQWMELIKNRLSNAYIDVVENFLDYAFTKFGELQLICCPCIKCGNATSRSRGMVRSHLIVHGINQVILFGSTMGRCKVKHNQILNLNIIMTLKRVMVRMKYMVY